jgi:hypothetical protein
MRTPFLLALLAPACLLIPCRGEAGVCDPTRSVGRVSAAPVGCQFRFHQAGALDAMTLAVTLRDAFDTPVPCSTWVDIVDASPAFCVVDPTQLSTNTLTGTGWTTPQGEALYVFDRLGGRGTLTLQLSAAGCCHQPGFGAVFVLEETVQFTSPDLNGSCDPVVDVLDLGLWASCLSPSPYCRTSDFNCDSEVGVLDLALWASGL